MAELNNETDVNVKKNQLDYETSRIRYVEPNYLFSTDGSTDANDIRTGKSIEQAPLLENYCISLDLEVELSQRNHNVHMEDTDSEAQKSKSVIIMSWSSQKGTETMSFMSGRKVYSSVEEKQKDKDNPNPLKYSYDSDGNRSSVRYDNFFTTDYTGAYYDEIIHHGTTEILGITNVNIKYDSFQIPVVTMKFIDLRGMSLFAPIQAQRDNAYQGLDGMTADDVAHSFFQCFFMQPYPIFRLKLKGFYGKPVSYEVQLDKFKASFNSDSGNFEMECEFVGSIYSFLTDVSMPALIAAPYSDYLGQEYWNKQNFTLTGKDGEEVPMPTICELYKQINEIYSKVARDNLNDDITQNNLTEVKQLNQLNAIFNAHKNVVNELLSIMKSTLKYDNNKSFFNARVMYITEDNRKEFEGTSTVSQQVDGDAYNGTIYLLTSSDLQLKDWNSKFLESATLTEQINNLNGAIEAYNNEFLIDSNTKIESIGREKWFENTPIDVIDFDYTQADESIFNITAVNDEESPNTDNQIIAYIVNQKVTEGQQNDLKKYLVNKGKKCNKAYAMSFPYLNVVVNLQKVLQDSINEYNNEENTLARRENELLQMIDEFEFYPSVENITKIIFAHFETLIWMVYQCASNINDSQRKLKDLGLSLLEVADINPDNFSQDALNKSDIYVGPFPRFTREETVEGSDIKEYKDTWIAKEAQDERFEEYKLVIGLFNGADVIVKELSDSDKAKAETDNAVDAARDSANKIGTPLSVNQKYAWKNIAALSNIMDLFATGHLFGEYAKNDDKTPRTDFGEFVRAISLRAFTALALPNNAKDRDIYANELGSADAYNLALQFQSQMPDNELAKMINAISDEKLWKMVTDRNNEDVLEYSKSLPWDGELFSNKNGSYWLRKYSLQNVNGGLRYPVQGYNPKELEEDTTVGNKYINFIPTKFNITSSDALKKICETYSGDVAYQIVGFTDFRDIGSNYEAMLKNVEFSSDIIKNDFKCLQYQPTEYDKWFRFPSPLFAKKGTKDKYEGELKIGADNANGFEANAYIQSSWEGSRDNTNKYVLAPYKENGKNKKYETTYNLNKLSDLSALYGSTESARMALLSTESIYTMGGFINGINIIDYTPLKEAMTNKTPVLYLPRLAVMQLGAICYAQEICVKSTNFNLDAITKYIPLPVYKKDEKDILEMYLSNLSQLSRVKLANYFIKNIEKHQFHKKYLEARHNNKWFPPELSNWLIAPVVLAKTSKYANKKYQEGTTDNLDGFSMSNYKAYMRGFLTKINELWGTNATVSTVVNSVPQTLRESDSVTREMKLSLYGYLKLLYDKWIPNYDFCEWKTENFFTNTEFGHTFHFIDAYYNKIGNRVLINLHSIQNNVRNLLGENAYKSNMFQFITQLLQENQFQLMTTQNFQNLADKDALQKMFKPLPYNEMGASKKSPDFVAIYTYKPSAHLANPHGQFKDDGFMLNGEKIPLPLQNGEGYILPAFGVAYGKQYQSYFNSIKVDINNPQATEVALKSKFAIVGEAMKYGHKTANFIGQDLFDIYSENSYECTVEMLGDAWVQPLMYFCLTNIPMFKGSYMIYHVEHDISQGKMVTRFTGVRMASISSPINSQFLINGKPISYVGLIRRKDGRAADTGNNCRYMVYDVYSKDTKNANHNELLSDTDISKYYRNKPVNDFENVKEALTYAIIEEAGPVAGDLAWYLVATTFYNKYHQDKKYICDSVQYSAYQKDLKSEYKGNTNLRRVGEIVEEVFDNSPSCLVAHGFVTQPSKSKASYAYADSKRFKKGANLNIPVKLTMEDVSTMVSFYNTDENPDSYHQKMKPQCKHKTQVYGADDETKPLWNEEKIPTTITPNQLAIGLFNAIQKSINSSTAARCDLKYQYIGDSGTSKTILITQSNGDTDHLAQVFDITLNGYYDYVHELRWCLESGNNSFVTPTPNGVMITVKEKSDNSQAKKVGMTLYSEIVANDLIYTELEYETAISYEYARAIFKKYTDDAIYEKEVVTKVTDVFEKVKITDCSEIIGTHNGAPLIDNMYVGEDHWNVAKASNFLISEAFPNYTESQCGYCASAVKSAIAVGGIPYLANCNGKDVVNQYVENRNFEILGQGNSCKTDQNYAQLMSNPQVGDICSFIYEPYGHVALFCGNGWYSDYKQNQAAPKAEKDCPWVYARYSANGGSVTNDNPVMIHWQHSRHGNSFAYEG